MEAEISVRLRLASRRFQAARPREQAEIVPSRFGRVRRRRVVAVEPVVELDDRVEEAQGPLQKASLVAQVVADLVPRLPRREPAEAGHDLVVDGDDLLRLPDDLPPGRAGHRHRPGVEPGQVARPAELVIDRPSQDVGPIERELVRVEAPALEQEDARELIADIDAEVPVFGEGIAGPIIDGDRGRERGQLEPGPELLGFRFRARRGLGQAEREARARRGQTRNAGGPERR